MRYKATDAGLTSNTDGQYVAPDLPAAPLGSVTVPTMVAEKLDPAQPDAHYRLARLYRAMGNSAAAQREFAKVSELQEKAEDMAPKMSGSPPSSPK